MLKIIVGSVLILSAHGVDVEVQQQASIKRSYKEDDLNYVAAHKGEEDEEALQKKADFRVCGNYCGPGWCNNNWIAEKNCDTSGPVQTTSFGPSCADSCCQTHDSCCGSSDRTRCNTDVIILIISRYLIIYLIKISYTHKMNDAFYLFIYFLDCELFKCLQRIEFDLY